MKNYLNLNLKIYRLIKFINDVVDFILLYPSYLRFNLKFIPYRFYFFETLISFGIMRICWFNLAGLNFIGGKNIHGLDHRNFSLNYYINMLMNVLFNYNNLGLIED